MSPHHTEFIQILRDRWVNANLHNKQMHAPANKAHPGFQRAYPNVETLKKYLR